MRQTFVHARDLGLGADQDLSLIEPIEIGEAGYLGIQAQIDNGAGGAPSDAPVGTWELWVASDGRTYGQLATQLATAQLANIASNGNNVVRSFAVFRGVPGTHAKIRYKRTSGGGGNSRAMLIVTVER